MGEKVQSTRSHGNIKITTPEQAAKQKLSLDDAMKLLEKYEIAPTPTPTPVIKQKVKDAIKEGAKQKYRGVGGTTKKLLDELDASEVGTPKTREGGATR